MNKLIEKRREIFGTTIMAFIFCSHPLARPLIKSIGHHSSAVITRIAHVQLRRLPSGENATALRQIVCARKLSVVQTGFSELY